MRLDPTEVRSDEGISLGFSPLVEKDVLSSQLESQFNDVSNLLLPLEPRARKCPSCGAFPSPDLFAVLPEVGAKLVGEAAFFSCPFL